MLTREFLKFLMFDIQNNGVVVIDCAREEQRNKASFIVPIGTKRY